MTDRLARKVKIRFKLLPDPDGVHQYATESLWATPVGDKMYRLDNSPFFVYGVSAEDIVVVEVEDGELWFEKVKLRGGHSTYRLFLDGSLTVDDSSFQRFWKPIEALGCTYENANSRWIAVDLPPGTNIRTAYGLFEKGEAEGVWAFEEGHCGVTLDE